jgi:hypothetical protein
VDESGKFSTELFSMAWNHRFRERGDFMPTDFRQAHIENCSELESSLSLGMDLSQVRYRPA